MGKPPATIATMGTLAMVRTAAARGVPTADVLAGTGITMAQLEDPDGRLPGAAAMSVWDALRERTGDPALQLAAPASVPFGAYRIVDYLVSASATVGEGMECFARYFGLITRGVTLRTTASGNERSLVLTSADGDAFPPAYVDFLFAMLVSRIRMRMRPRIRVLRVEFRQATPASTAPYARHFAAPVRFRAPVDRITFDATEWNAPTTGADATLAALMEEHARMLAARVPAAEPDFKADVQRVIATARLDGGSADEVAKALNVSVRTLQRKLAEADTTFRDVSEEVRSRLAQAYLSDPTVAITEVAFMLGFSDASSFVRAFRRWTGDAPGRWRRRHAAESGRRR